MTHEEKAKELVNKFRTYVVMWSGGTEVENENVKQCALICVDETLNVLNEMPITVVTKFYIQYCQQVKQEIEKQ